MNQKIKRFLTIFLSAALIAGLAACGQDTDNTTGGSSSGTGASSGSSDASDSTSSTGGGEGDTFIADRTIVVQAYVDDIGYSMPEDFNNTPVGKELTKRTGIKLDLQYTPGDNDLSVMTTHLASGDIPDVIVSYLNNSARPEFAILLKAAQEEVFADVAPYLAEGDIYSKYSDESYMPADSYKNVMFREEFNGAAYLVSCGVPRVDKSLTFEPDEDFIGGMYIQKAIADDLEIDPREIRTQDQLYDLLVSIKEGGYKDDNGNPVWPLGPKYWGGSSDSLDFVLREMNWGISNNYNLDEDGEFKHEAQTEYAMMKVNYLRKLLSEGLMNPEFFTMDSTRAEEVSTSKNSGIIGDVHNYVDIIYGSSDWLPVGPLNDYKGDNKLTAGGKSSYGVWAVSSGAESPEEIVAYFDYLSGKEGKLLVTYGIEGLSYELEDGQPRLTAETQAKLDEGDTEWLSNEVGADFGGAGNYFFGFVTTDQDALTDFGEARPGASAGETFAGALAVAEYSPREYKLVPGLEATAYLNDPSLNLVNTQMSLLNYDDTLIQAVFADSETIAKQILDSFVSQLEASGFEEFKTFVMEQYEKDPESINFY